MKAVVIGDKCIDCYLKAFRIFMKEGTLKIMFAP
jgi:hypothetical protein